MTTPSNAKVRAHRNDLEIRLPDTRGVTISRFGQGNYKIGPGVVTYSKLPIVSCPGVSSWCSKDCYAKRIGGSVSEVHRLNTECGAAVPDLPHGTQLVRIHVSGDFDSAEYIQRWTWLAGFYSETLFWAYTRSWRIPALLPHLEEFRALPNVQLFASMDESIRENPPAGWRVAWIEGDPRIRRSMVCPEETGRKLNCEACRYCFVGRRGDVTFLRH